MILLDMLIIAAGFVLLLSGANFLVDGASSLAARLGIPAIVIGLTIVALGTSAPELVVNVYSSVNGNTGITMGNVLGSNIFNILVILGVSSVITPLAVRTTTTWIEIPLCFMTGLLVFVTANDSLIDGRSFSEVSRIDGIVMLFFFVIFMGYNFYLSRSDKMQEQVKVEMYSFARTLIFILGGLLMLVAGGNLVVHSAVRVAEDVGVSQRIIGLTIVSVGTSLPELATSTVAALKKNVDIAIGNIVGSNIFNALFILGISSLITPVPLQPLVNLDIAVNIAASLLLFIFIFTGKGNRVERFEGIIFLLLYLCYMVYVIKSPVIL